MTAFERHRHIVSEVPCPQGPSILKRIPVKNQSLRQNSALITGRPSGTSPSIFLPAPRQQGCGLDGAVFGADNSDERQCLGLVADAAKVLGGLDVLVTNAGKQDTQERIEDISTEQFVKTFAVNAIAPGPFWTALQPSGGQTDEKVRHFGQDSAFGRPGQPAEIAAAFMFLATGEPLFMTGETFGVTGGKPIA